jgi:hypothetical protein
MKRVFYIVFAFSLLLLYSCQENDTLDDGVIVGNMAPQVYWELGSSTVLSGDSVPFSAQYYTTGLSPVDHLEVWYNVVEEKSKTVACSWVSSFTYAYNSATSDEKRMDQKISIYPHDDNLWVTAKRAYVFSSKFPSSPTLSSLSWQYPETFDSTRMVKYFGESFMQHFKDSLYSLMKPVDFQKMYQGLNLVENFKQAYMDSVRNENTGDYEYIFKNNVVPAEVKNIYATIPFSDLIYNSSNNYYNVSYSLQYILKPTLRVYDKNGVYGITTKKEVTLN